MDYATKMDSDGRPYVELRPQTSDERSMVELLFPRAGEVLTVVKQPDFESIGRIRICRVSAVDVKPATKYDHQTIQELETILAERGISPGKKATRSDMIDMLNRDDSNGVTGKSSK